MRKVFVAAAFLCAAPAAEAKCVYPPLYFQYYCQGQNPVPVSDNKGLAQEAQHLLQNVQKTTQLAQQVMTQAQKLTDMTSMLQRLGHPSDALGALTQLGQFKEITAKFGQINQLASMLKSLMSGGSVPNIAMIKNQVQSLLPKSMSGANPASLPSLTSAISKLFSSGGSSTAVTAQRRTFAMKEATDAQAASAIAYSNLAKADEDIKKIQEGVSGSKDVREDWQANTKARMALLESINTRIALLARINATNSSRTLAGQGDDANAKSK